MRRTPPQGNRPRLQLEQKQTLTLTPALKQALQILTMPTLELAAYIQLQLEENPALELAEPALAGEQGQEGLAYDEAEYDTVAESWERLIMAEGVAYQPPPERTDFLSPWQAAPGGGLAEYLRLQLAVHPLEPGLQAVADFIIEHLDEDGYFSLTLPELAAAAQTTSALAAAALAAVQALEPAGVAARDLPECLRLQIAPEAADRALLLRVIDHHLADVARNRVQETARVLGCGKEQLDQAFAQVRALNPRPAAAFAAAAGSTPYLLPDIIVEQSADGYQVRFPAGPVPQLQVSGYYRRLKREIGADAEAHAYLQDRLQAALMLIRNIDKRRDTLLRLAQITVERQRAFLDEGLAALQPLTMREVAVAAELHESTVSRAVAGKYMQTPRGLYAWKFFFPRAYTTPAGSLTPAWVKAQLKLLLEGEDRTIPFTDGDLQALLAGRGIRVARRTVAKYREELGIPPRHVRRRQGSLPPL